MLASFTMTCFIGFRQGGKDPLDHIYVLLNRGDPNQGIPDHWHFITFGFSDLHGDSRVHEYVNIWVKRVNLYDKH